MMTIGKGGFFTMSPMRPIVEIPKLLRPKGFFSSKYTQIPGHDLHTGRRLWGLRSLPSLTYTLAKHSIFANPIPQESCAWEFSTLARRLKLRTNQPRGA